MKRLGWKWLWRAVLGTAVLIAVAAAMGYAFLRGTIAPVIGDFTVAGITAPVTISFDELERAYVRADTLEDALFAEGWLHASHRLWQMDMFRRAGQGRLSELLGSSMLDSDRELWRMGVPQLAATLERNATPDLQRMVDAYLRGVNEALASGSFRAIEYLLLQKTPEPWKSRDVYAVGALMAFQSANNSENELLRLALFSELDEPRARAFLSHDDDASGFPYVLATTDTDSIGRVADVLNRIAATDPADCAWMPRFTFGSNGWAVSPGRSASGHALFAFDSHDDLGLPDLFYEVHLFFGDGRQIRGWSAAGLPGVINGYNERIAWGFTNIGDTQDLFVETRSPDNPRQFKDGDTWYEARTETVEIPVSGRSEPDVLEITYTRNGPLISDDPPIALRWTIQDVGTMGLDSILDMNLSRNWEEFTAALDRFAAPALNATYADIDGNIGFRTAGLLPIRGHGSGLVPLAGDDPNNRWIGLVPADEMPEMLNPSSGYVAAANARVNRLGDGPLVSADNAPPYRIARLRTVLSARSDFTTEDMRRLQMDWYDEQAAMVLPALLDAIDSAARPALQESAVEALLEWNGDFRAQPENAAPILYQAWYRALAVEVFRPGLREETFKLLFKNNYLLNQALDWLILHDRESPWWRGDFPGIVRAALQSAVEEIRAVQGDSIAEWRLDRMHKVKLEHELGKAVPQLGWLFNANPAPWGGSTATVGRARYRYDRAYDVTSAATLRVVGEMAGPSPRMQAVICGGQSGHPLSAHYTDQFSSWLNGELNPIHAAPADVQGSIVTLTPSTK